MKSGDFNTVIIAVAAVATALWMHMQYGDLQKQLSSCESEFNGFKDGVIYGK